jgi:hypothetical protein
MGLKGYRLWAMGQLDSTWRAPPLVDVLNLAVGAASLGGVAEGVESKRSFNQEITHISRFQAVPRVGSHHQAPLQALTGQLHSTAVQLCPHLGGDVAQHGGAGLLDVALHVLALFELVANGAVGFLRVGLSVDAGFLVEVADGGPAWRVQGGFRV